MSGRRNTSRSYLARSRKRRAPIRAATTSKTSAKPQRAADIIFLNAEIITLDSAHPRVKALAIDHGHITKTGTNQEALSVAGRDTRIWELDGATVLPGFTDCHTHVVSYGIQLLGANLRKATSISEIQTILRKHAYKMKSGTWLLAYGWDQERLRERRYPSRQDLDAVVKNRPACITRVCEHICVANSSALQLANITRRTTSPVGGIIDLDETGEPTGVLKENAMDLVLSQVPALDGPELRKATLLAMRKAVSAGLTSIHCAVDQPQHVRVLQAINGAGDLPARIHVLIPSEWLGPAGHVGISSGFGDEMLRIQAIKVFTDGSLGAHTASLEAPYSDSPDTRGVLMHSQEELNSIVESASRQGFQVAIHAIGDHAIAMALTAFENARRKVPECDKLRHRIEHLSVLNPDLIKRIRRARVIASVQPHFIRSDSWVPARVGRDRAKFVYPLRTLLKSGAIVVGGSDCPVEPIDPLEGICAAVSSATSEYGERISVADAIRLFTKNSVYATNQEKVKGTIHEGKMADLVVLDRDPFKVPAEQIREIKVLATIVGGRVVYESKRFQCMKTQNGRGRLAGRHLRTHSP